MADLDDFFAKKDKKKKTKKGFSKANTEVLAKNLEENERKEQQAEEKANDVIGRIIEPDETAKNDIDEWKEYEDRKLDYTTLKIDTLKVDEDPNPDDEGDDVNEDGEKVKRSKEGGPWSKLVASDSADKSNDVEEKSVPAPVVEKEDPPEPAPATKSSYVPPHLRNASSASANAAASSGGPAGARAFGRKQKHAPDISSEVYFPSLSAAMGTDDPNRGQGQENTRGFEEVKSGGSQSSYNSRASEAPKLALDNKFAALRE